MDCLSVDACLQDGVKELGKWKDWVISTERTYETYRLGLTLCMTAEEDRVSKGKTARDRRAHCTRTR